MFSKTTTETVKFQSSLKFFITYECEQPAEISDGCFCF